MSSAKLNIPGLSAEAEAAWSRLFTHLQGLPGKVLLAFSGGVDSSFLAFAIKEVRGAGDLLCVLADSPSLARQEKVDAVAFAQENGLPLEVILGSEMEDPAYLRNEPDRCYHCKKDLFNHLTEIAVKQGISEIVYGANLDDQFDFRPGARAAEQFKVTAPLQLTGFTKTHIRELAKAFNLKVWDKPAKPCLSSRLPYGLAVSRERLQRVEKAEAVLASLGFKEFRVRHSEVNLPTHVNSHSSERVASIELAIGECGRISDEALKDLIEFEIKAVGFTTVMWVTTGLRSGSLNAKLSEAEKKMALGERA